MRYLLLAFLLLPWPASGESLPIGEGLVLDLPLPESRWNLVRTPPEGLLAETAEHLGHELEAQGKSLSQEALLDMARKRLASNEAYVVNPETGAHLIIDFSPLREGEKVPREKSIAASARYAGEGLKEEEGISDLRYETSKMKLPGATSAYRLQASFRHHGDPKKFSGVIGFSDPYWFYLYYTDPLKDPRDLVEMEALFDSMVLRRSGAP